ncbi:MAG TPA: FIST N-terminal domain-containing protein [Solirubrobacterales bacterium]|nr:FIST N-terminal domain-containing protein [Solirubrobacterales bacterium]
MAVRIAVGVSESFDAVEAFDEAAAGAARELDAACDLCIVFAGAPHLGHGKWILSAVHDRLDPANLIGCGAGGVVAGRREIEEGPGAVVWALAAPGAEIRTHHFTVEQSGDGFEVIGLPQDGALGDALVVLADPYSFSTESLLARLNAEHPGLPVLGGLASAAIPGSGTLFRDGDVLSEGAVGCSLAGLPVLPCVSQGAAPVGPEMTITAAHENVIEELASRPALERLAEAIAGLEEHERDLARAGVMLGVVIDENKPDYGRGDFLIRPVIGADQDASTIAIGERVRVGQIVRLHVRDATVADEDLREALGLQSDALGSTPAAGALMFTCNGRGSHMFNVEDHDASALDDVLGVPAGGFFCAGEIGPVGGRNFLHGFTATLAVFPAE